MSRGRAIVLAAGILAVAGGCVLQKILLNDLRDAILPDYFSAEAIGLVGDVPMYQGDIDGYALSVGDDWGSRFLSALFGYGNERQVLVPFAADEPRLPWVDLLVFHEYIHQCDYSDVLSRELFIERLAQYRQDPAYADDSAALDALLESLGGNGIQEIGYIYDDGLNREALAYVIEAWVDGCIELPGYMLDVYDGVVLPNPALRTDGACSSGFKSIRPHWCAVARAHGLQEPH
ncbi:MAG: hypothetical protein AMXMBFR84_40050 [Candidatus Hydrogenedentota bacterium]